MGRVDQAGLQQGLLWVNSHEHLHVLHPPLAVYLSLSILQVIIFVTSGHFSQTLLTLGREPRDTWSVTSVWLAKATRYKPHRKQLILRSRLKSIAIDFCLFVCFLLHSSLLSTSKVLCSIFSPGLANTGLIAEVTIYLAVLMGSKGDFYNPLI